MHSDRFVSREAAARAAIFGGALLLLSQPVGAQQASTAAPATLPNSGASPVSQVASPAIGPPIPSGVGTTPAQQRMAAAPASGTTGSLIAGLQMAAAPTSGRPGSPATDLKLAEAAPAGEPPVEETPGQASTEPTGKKLKLDINGFAQLDSIYDFNRVNPNWEATLRPSRIPVPNTLPKGESIWSIRQSRLNFVGTTPTSVGEVRARFEFDLFGVGQDEGQTTIRIRHVYGEMGRWLFGQTNSVFMDGDLFPNIIDYWGPIGMVFLRNPMVRYTALNKKGQIVRVSLEQSGSAVDSGKLDEVIDPDLGLNTRNRWPDLAAHYRLERPWGHVQVAGILRYLGYESSTSPDGEPSGSETGGGISLGGIYKVAKRDKVYAQLTYGGGISNYMNDGGNDLAPSSDLRSDVVTSEAWELYYEHAWNRLWTSSLGYSQHRNNNTGGQTGDAYKNGSYVSANLLYSPSPDILMGLEYLWGERKNKDGRAGIDNRIQFSFKYAFSN